MTETPTAKPALEDVGRGRAIPAGSVFKYYAQTEGGYVEPPPGSDLSDFLTSLHRTADLLVSTGRKNGQPMEVEIGWFNSLSFDAYSASSSTVDLVALSVGLPLIAFGFCRGMLSHPHVFPKIGTFENYEQTRFSFGKEIVEFPNDASLWDVPPLLDPVREALASRLANGVIRYVMAHELAHIMNGHCDLPNDLSDRIKEASGSSPGLVSQTLEWDADLKAAGIMLNATLRPTWVPTSKASKWIIPPTNPFGGVAEAIALTTIVSSVSHAFFANMDDLLQHDLENRSHPPSFVRLKYNLAQITGELRHRAGIPTQESFSYIEQGASELAKGIGAMFPGRASHKKTSPDGEGPPTFPALMKEYGKQWSKLHPHFDLVKRGGRLADADSATAPL